MKRQLWSLIGLIAFIFITTSGLFKWFTNVFTWLITLDLSSPTISIIGELFVKYTTWLITFALVGMLFRGLHWFNSPAMKIVYFIISTLISFVFSYVVMILENYLLYIVIALGVLLLITIAVIIFLYIKSKHNNKSEGVNGGILQHSSSNE